jgi:TolB-like protein
VVVDRRELDLIRQEERFQMSGEVSDESMQSIGKKLGAQIIVSGSLNAMGGAYRFRMRALNVETAVVETGSTADLSMGETKIAFMLSGARPAPIAAPRPLR